MITLLPVDIQCKSLKRNESRSRGIKQWTIISHLRSVRCVRVCVCVCVCVGVGCESVCGVCVVWVCGVCGVVCVWCGVCVVCVWTVWCVLKRLAVSQMNDCVSSVQTLKSSNQSVCESRCGFITMSSVSEVRAAQWFVAYLSAHYFMCISETQEWNM